MTNLNKEQIEFIDQLFIDLYAKQDKYELYRKQSKYKLPEFDYLNNYALTIAEELGLVVLDKTYVNKIVVDFHKIPCDNFIDNGGFKTYFFNQNWGKRKDGLIISIPLVISILTLSFSVYKHSTQNQKTVGLTIPTNTLIADSILKVENQKLHNSIFDLESKLNLLTDSLYYSSLDTIKIDTVKKAKNTQHDL